MTPVLVLLPLTLVLAAFSFGVGRSLLRIWLDHRMKLAILSRYEAHPELFESSQDLMDAIKGKEGIDGGGGRQDYSATGVFLVLIGAGCVAGGRVLAVGNTAVGINVGGIICIVLGVLIYCLGRLMHALARNPIEKPDIS